MKKLDFVAAVDLFHNPTTMALADIVLPAATFAEKDGFRSWWAPLSVSHKAVQVGECKSDWEINLEMAKRLNPEVGKKFATVRDLINGRLETAGTTFQKMVDKGCWEMPPEGPFKPYRRHERGLLRGDGKPGFNTPTGKVELWSKTYEGWGLDPLPYFKEPAQSPVSTPELYKKYPLIMIAGTRSPLFFHAEHRDDSLAAGKVSRSARGYSSRDGERVWTFTTASGCISRTIWGRSGARRESARQCIPE